MTEDKQGRKCPKCGGKMLFDLGNETEPCGYQCQSCDYFKPKGGDE